MKSNEWLSVMQQAEDYNPQLTPLIIKYGELLLSEHPVSQPVAELPKEATLKAKELVDKFEPMCLKYKGAAQKCALICVDEIIKALTHQNPNFEDNTYWSPIDYWQQVRTAINQL